MFRHVVLLTLDERVSAEELAELRAALEALPAAIPEIRSYSVGLDAGLAPDNATVAVVADFEDRLGYERYRDHPAHRAVIETRIAPRLLARTAVQHEV